MAAILLGNFVWEGKSTELPTGEQGAMDGHIMRCLDTGESYIRRYGVWVLINLGLSQIAATKSGQVTTDAQGVHAVIFTTPIINIQYSVTLTCTDQPPFGNEVPIAYVSNISITGFTITTRGTKAGDVMGNISVSWLATRHYNP